MVVLYKKRTNKNPQTARNKIKDCRQEGRCPACGEGLKLTEAGKDRDTFACEKCKSTVTFTKSPFEQPSQRKHEKRMGAITLRDKSTRSTHKENPREFGFSSTADVAVLSKIRDCMTSHNLINFDYTDSNKVTTARTVEPYKLTKRNGDIILYGYDVEGNGIRVFKISRIAALEKQSYSFKPRWEIEDKLISKDDNAEAS